jgi:hypothetical protein
MSPVQRCPSPALPSCSRLSHCRDPDTSTYSLQVVFKAPREVFHGQHPGGAPHPGGLPPPPPPMMMGVGMGLPPPPPPGAEQHSDMTVGTVSHCYCLLHSTLLGTLLSMLLEVAAIVHLSKCWRCCRCCWGSCCSYSCSPSLLPAWEGSNNPTSSLPPRCVMSICRHDATRRPAATATRDDVGAHKQSTHACKPPNAVCCPFFLWC